jgi:high-affinity iron transporter
MQAWRDQSLADVAALADAVLGFDASAPDTTVAPDELALGARIYAANCVQCHGTDGDGRGIAAAELRIAPTDFREQRPSLALAVRALAMGVEGTQMAPWNDRLSGEEQRAVAHYVRSLFEGGAGGGRAP